MVARLFSKFGPRKGDDFTIMGAATIGRAGDCAVTIPHKAVSANHARIFRDEDRDCYILEDLGSQNGTLLDGVRLEGPERLGRLHEITFAGSLVYFYQDLMKGDAPARPGASVNKTTIADEPTAFNLAELLANAETDQKKKVDTDRKPVVAPGIDVRQLKAINAVNQTIGEKEAVQIPSIFARPARPPEAPAHQGPAQFQLRVTNLREPLVLPLREGSNVVGRSRSVSLYIRDIEISRKHAVITVTDGSITIRDAGSTNKTFVNHDEVFGEGAVNPGDLLSFGKVEAVIEKIG